MLETIALLALAQEPLPEPAPPSWILRLRLETWQAKAAGWGHADEALGFEFEGDRGDLEGPRLSLAGDGGIRDRAPVRRLEIAAEFPGLGAGLRLVGLRGRWSGEGVLGQDVVAGGTTVPAGTPTESTMDFHFVALEAFGSPGTGPEGPAFLRVGMGLAFFGTRLEVATAQGRIEDGPGGGPFSFALEGGCRPLPWLDVGAQGRCILPFGAPYAELGVQAGAAWGPLRLEAGYRWAWSRMDAETVATSLRLDGPFLGLSLSF